MQTKMSQIIIRWKQIARDTTLTINRLNQIKLRKHKIFNKSQAAVHQINRNKHRKTDTNTKRRKKS